MSAQIFGLDIGRSLIKIAQVKVSGGKKELVTVGNTPSTKDGLKTESRPQLKELSEIVKTLVKNSRIEGNRCAVSIVEAQTVTRLVELPNLTDKELSSAINWEADQYIPLPLKDVNLQYKVVFRPQPGTNGKMQVLLIAAPKRVVDKYLEVVKMAGLELCVLETESSSLARALTTAYDPLSLMVSIGAVSTEMILAKGGNAYFSRSVASGGQALTKTIMSEFSLSEKQAEEYKIAYGLLEDKLSGKIAAVLKPVLDILVGEILKAVEYGRTHMQGDLLTRVIICGGGAYLPGLSEFITEKTSMEVILADPWADFSKNGLILKVPGQGSFYSVATGLALRT